MRMIKATTLFSSAGIDEYFLEKAGVRVVVANELLKDRSELYSAMYPKSKMIQGDIMNDDVFNEVVENSREENIDILIATPPCQGVSLIGKNKSIDDMISDKRNYLLFRIIDFINETGVNYILIENVPRYLKLLLPYEDKLLTIEEILNLEFSDKYEIDIKVLNVKDYGVPQNRKRAVIKIYKKGLEWGWPEQKPEITLKEAIGHLPSLESGEDSGLEWHYAREHNENHINWMKHTPSGCSAFGNKIYFPQKKNGDKIKSFSACYSRMQWESPAPTITMRNDAVSSQRNVHPGKIKKDGTYSDARVLTIRELFLLTSLPEINRMPLNTSELLIRRCLGECVPPLFMKEICKKIKK